MRYISDSVISFSINVPGCESSARVTFSPLSFGGSTFSTESEALIKALESSEMYGSVYKRAPECVKEKVSAKKETAKTEEPAPLQAIDSVEEWQDAVAYLVENFKSKASQLKSPEHILKEAAKYNVWFPNLK